MAVTIQMIETKEFKLTNPSAGEQGYNPQDVDNFLDDIVDEIERMQKEIKTLRQEASARPRQQAPAAPASSASDETIRLMLANAQRVCDDTVSDAKRRSDDILRDARREAEHIVNSAQEEDRRLNEQLLTLRDAVSSYKAKFRQLIDDQMRVLKDDD